ncbi:phage tail protein [Pseudomonas sp. C11]|uniref:phage tail protein n=1 Tax=Pseudomonas sp. C11 TaxID=3075550 RepID=UPI002AFEA504|nr:phage tail protein [Pseudomonas sp. C11]
MLYSKSTGGIYDPAIHGVSIPVDAVAMSAERYNSVIANPVPGKIRSHDAEGLPILIDPPAYVPTADELCQRIDTAADAARRAVAGDPLRAVEYDRARLAAEQFAAADYLGEVPAMVAAWAINGRTPQQAADSILAEAAAYTNALELLRSTRLAAKEQIRTLIAAGEVEQAQQLTDQTIATIEAAVAGIGNNA